MQLDISELSMVEITPNGFRVQIDWLSFTFHPRENFSVRDVMVFLGFKEDDFIKTAKGANGYRSMHIFKGANIRVLSDGNPDMGIHIDISGSAIATLLNYWQRKNTSVTPFETTAIMYQDLDYTLLLDLLDSLSKTAKITRLDLAIDDIGCNYFSCDDVYKLIKNQQIISKFKRYDIRKSSYLNDGAKHGYTIYLGSRTSDIFLRIYDKQLEQLTKGEECPYPWVRWEFELKGDRANKAVQLLLETHSLSVVCLGILKHYLRFIVHDNPVKSRCSNVPTWDAFLENAKKLSLYVPDSLKTLTDTKRWIDKYVGASLSAIIEADGGCLDFIYRNLPKWQERRMRNRNLTNRLQQALKDSEIQDNNIKDI